MLALVGKNRDRVAGCGGSRGSEAMKVTGRSRPAAGITAVAVLVCLVVVTLSVGRSSRSASPIATRCAPQEQRLQAEWLAQSGLDRALCRLAAERGYTGETWTTRRADLGLAEAGGPQVAAGRVVRSRSRRPAGRPERS